MHGRALLLGFLIAIFLFVQVSEAQLSPCTVTQVGIGNTCPTGIEVLRMEPSSDTPPGVPTNMHVAVPGTINWGSWVVCCNNVNNLVVGTAVCTGTEKLDYDEMLMMGGKTSNAHAEYAENKAKSSFANPIPLCLRITSKSEGVDCTETNNACSTISSRHVCVITVSTSGHVASCTRSPYTKKICCAANADMGPPNLTFVPPTPRNMSISLGNNGNKVDWLFINVSSNEPLKKGTCSINVRSTGFPRSLSGGNYPGATHTSIPGTISGRNNETCSYNFTGLKDGLYDVYVNASDNFANRGSTLKNIEITPNPPDHRREIFVMGNLPVSTINFPKDKDLFGLANWTPREISGSATDNDAGQGLKDIFLSVVRISDNRYLTSSGGWQQLPGIEWISTGGASGQAFSWNYPFTPTTNADKSGEFTVRSNATDIIGFNESPLLSTITFALDFNPPVAKISSKRWNGGSLGIFPTYSGTAIDNVNNGYQSGVARVEWEVKNNQSGRWLTKIQFTDKGVAYRNSLYDAKGRRYSVDFVLKANLTSGLNNVSIRALDAAGNTITSDSDLVNYDTTYPFVIITAPANAGSPYSKNAWLNAKPIQGQARDSDGRITSLDISIQNVSDGSYWNNKTGMWVVGEYWIPVEGRGSTSGPDPEVYDPWNWTYNPEVGTYKINARAVDNANNESVDTVTVVYDPVPPKGWIEDLPSWTNNESITVRWNGTDVGGGIASFLVEYKIEIGSGPGSWAPLLPPVTTSGSATLFNVKNKAKYSFRVTVTDLAGNDNKPIPIADIKSVSVDLEDPLCNMVTLPPINNGYGPSPLILNWTVDEDESGVDKLNAWVKPVGNDWKLLKDYAAYSCTAVTSNSNGSICSQIPEGAYEFKCGANDTAGNLGRNSTAIEITVDDTGPSGGIKEPSGPWINRFPFLLKWEFEDDKSGVDYANVQWKDNIDPRRPWNSITEDGKSDIDLDPTSLTSISFGQGNNNDSYTKNEGDTLAFRARGVDKVGKTEDWGLIVSAIIDTIAPKADMRAFDQNKVLIVPPRLSGVNSINISSNASDPKPATGSESGIETHTIWVQRSGQGLIIDKYECNQKSYCETDYFDIGEVAEIVYWVEVIDKAGNKYTSPSETLASHPLANFVSHDILLNLGTEFVLDVQVRNLNSETLTYVELNLSKYELAGFTGGSGDFSGKPIISSDGRNAVIKNLQAGGRGVLKVRLSASDPGKINPLDLGAMGKNSIGSLIIKDNDTTRINMNFPASFSGMNDLAILFLVIIALGIYGFVIRKE